MMGKSRIEWCDRTWNPVTGCTQISPGCKNCYAKRMAERFAGPWGLDQKEPFKVTLHHDRLNEPLRWKKPSKVFVCSMSDLFHEDVPEKFIVDVLSVVAELWQHTFLILTKRPERMRQLFFGHANSIANDVWLQTSRGVTAEKSPWPLPNLWIGVTAESQEQANKRIPILFQTPAAKRFVSIEPMLGAIDLKSIDRGSNIYLNALSGEERIWNDIGGMRYVRSWNKLDWVICGGESGPRARPMHPNWARWLRDQCNAFGTPFLFKQWGEWSGELFNGRSSQQIALTINGETIGGGSKYGGFMPSDEKMKSQNAAWMRCVGKKASGRLLDGELWDQYPEVQS